jgi:uncharacterized YigZ family protein
VKEERDLTSDDRFWTIKDPVSANLTVKGSRFIGDAAPVGSEEAAGAFIAEICRMYHDATHHCTAYRVRQGDGVLQRYRDDGEPSGTAGKPILDEIACQSLDDVVCVVSRYFGGTKLGTGGLMRAYRQCASETLKKAIRVEHFETLKLTVQHEYDHTGIIRNCINRFNGKVQHSVYDDARPRIIVEVRRSMAGAFEQEVIEKTAGTAQIRKEEVMDH